MVLGPAIAFFIAILGLNAFGEGLRRIFDRWPFSTAFILKKRMLLIVAGFIGLSIVIFQMTNAGVSYQQVAASFDITSANMRYEELKIYNNISRENENSPVIGYLIGKLREYDIQPGWSETLTSYHYFPISTTLLQPETTPRLMIGRRDIYKFENEFSYLTEGCAGSGRIQAPLVFLGGLSFEPSEKMKGKIVMMLEEGTSSEDWASAAAAGVGGMILVTSEQPPLLSQYEAVLDPEDQECAPGIIPVFRIPSSVARRVAAESGINWDQLYLRASEESFITSFPLNGMMELDLSPPKIVVVPNVNGFIGGYDFDHADEIVVIYTTFDGLGLSEYQQDRIPEDDLEKIAVLLEIMRTWHEKNLDPRRSVQFVIWGGEGIEEPFYEMIYGLFEKNKLAAKVPTNMNPYVNENPVKPAIWVEIGDLSSSSGSMAYSDQSTEFLSDIFYRAAGATNLSIKPGVPASPGVSTGLPNIFLWEDRSGTPTSEPNFKEYTSKGIMINRTLIQLLRDMKN